MLNLEKIHLLIQKRYSRRLIVTAVIFFCILCFVFFVYKGEKAESTYDTQKISISEFGTPELITIKAVAQEVVEEVRSIGIVEAVREVQICPEISGKVKNFYCDVGDEVIRGHLLAELDGESRLIALEKAKAMLQKAEARHKKVKRDRKKAIELFKSGIISDSSYDDANLDSEISGADLALALAEVRSAEKQLRDTKITAPFTGKVTLRKAEIGSTVSPGKILFTLVTLSEVKIPMNLSEFDVTRISLGNQAMMRVDSLADAVFSGVVQTIGFKADDSTRTFPVEIIVANTEEKILPGMIARVCVKSSLTRKVILIPHKAIHSIHGKKVVTIINDGKIAQKKVVTGSLFNDQVIVDKGLVEGDEVVISAEPLKNFKTLRSNDAKSESMP